MKQAWLWFVAALSMWLAVMARGAATFDVGRFGAVGDGLHDDGPAIRQAIAAATNAGPGARVVLADKTYRLAEVHGAEFQFTLSRVAGLTLEGHGAILLNTPRNGLLLLNECTNVVVQGLQLDYDPLPFTQGTIRAVNPAERTIDLQIHPGYPLPLEDEAYKQRFGPNAWDWGTVIDPVARHRRWDVKDFNYIASVQLINRAESLYRLSLQEKSARVLQPLRPGDRYFMPLRYGDSQTGAHSQGANLAVRGSVDCRLEDITVFSARSGMNFLITRNEGRITLRGLRITFKPGTDRVVTTWRDGLHCKDNRVGPFIENCSFEGMLDDSINLGANTSMATQVLSPTEFQLTSSGFHARDAVLVVDPQSGRRLADTRVVAIHQREGRQVVVLEQPVAGVVTGSMRPHTDIRATHFYNMSYCGRGYIIRNCTFLPQRRHAILARSPDGLIEGNTVEGVGGSGVRLGNDVGSFYEGPFPNNVLVRNNVIQNPQGTGIAIYTGLPGKNAQFTGSIQVLNNRLTVLPNRLGIEVRKASDVVLSNNRILDGTGHDIGPAGLSVSASTNVKTN